MTKLSKKIIISAIILAVIIFSFIFTNAPVSENVEVPSVTPKPVTEISVADEPKAEEHTENTVDDTPQKIILTETVTDTPDAEAKPEEKEPGKETEAVQTAPAVSENAQDVLTCTLSVRCDDILKNMDKLKKEKVDYVPSDGKIYENSKAVFHEGESAFNLLIRELRSNGIHYEFVRTPIYNSSYIEGIGNLYEFDCGEQSGWTYKVNGKAPGYGCSQYKIKNNDVIEFIYSCTYGW